MSHHLSATQIAKCLAGTAEDPEQQHLRHCADCRAELDRFGSAISSFRNAVRDRVENHLDREPRPIASRSGVPGRALVPRWIFVLATTVVLSLGIVPLLTLQRPTQRAVSNESVTDPNTLMNAVDLHLLRQVPAPLEPMFVLIPTTDATPQSGGTR
jgi:hypothetical protein